jgi:hypothetical protein
MLGSEVIKQIQNLIDEYGDLPIEISLNGSDQEEVKELIREKYMPEFGSPVLDIDCIYKIIGASMDIEKPKILIEEGYVI